MARRKAEINLEEALRLYNDKTVPFKAAAKQLGVSPDTYRKFLREHGVDIPSRSGKASVKLTREAVEDLYINQNMTRKEVAEALDVSLSTVSRFITDNGIKKDKDQLVEQREATMMERYGVRHALDSDEFKEKMKSTGQETFARRRAERENNPEYQRRQQEKKQKKQEKKAASRPSFSDLSDEEKAAKRKEWAERRRQTMIEKYGVENPSNIPDAQEKRKNTMRERYGAECFFQTDEFKKRARKTNIEKYGTANPMQSDEVKAKTRATNMERYGGPSSMTDPEVKAKARATNIEKYGDVSPMRTEEVKQHLRDTMVELYGVDNPSKLEEFQEKKKETCRERYGTDYFGQQDIQHVDEWNDRDLFVAACKRLAAELGGKPHMEDLMDYFNVRYTVYSKVKAYGCSDLVNMSTSYVEDRWRRWLKDEGIPCSERPERVLDVDGGRPMEIDIYVPEHDLGIEIDPTSTHNSTVPYYNGSEPKAPSYHQRKCVLAEKAGINLVHVYDFADEDKMRSVIRSLCGKNARVFARETECRPIDEKAAKAFLQANHLQGHVKAARSYGLFYTGGDEGILSTISGAGPSNGADPGDREPLVAVMTFGAPRYGSGDEKDIPYEMLRFCSLDSLTVVGGASKLFKAFVKECSPSAVISYASYDISNGALYDALGFDFRRLTNPSYTWVRLGDPTDTYSWQVVNAKGFDNLFGTSYGKGTSNKELMEAAGFVQVYNAGNKVYVWEGAGK